MIVKYNILINTSQCNHWKPLTSTTIQIVNIIRRTNLNDVVKDSFRIYS